MPGLLLVSALFAPPSSARAGALDQPLQIAQYAHTAWTAPESSELGLVMAMAQTPDGYLWIAASYGLFRFDGVRFKKWEPPDGQSLPDQPYCLLVSRDGTLWIGTYAGLASWNGRDFIRRHPEVGVGFVTSLLESRDGTVWAGVLAEPGRLCAVRAGQVRCSVAEGSGFGAFVWSLAEDRAGNLWVGAESGVWRWSPGTPRRYPMTGLRVGDLTTTVDGDVLVGVMGGGLKQMAGEQLVPHRFRAATRPYEWLADGDVKSNKLLRDREGGLWIGTQDQGLIHVKDGQSDRFTQADGLSGNIACSLFEDREGTIWFGSSKGVDRFRRLPVTTLSSRQGVPHELTTAVVATTDGSVWVATRDGLVRWKDGRPTVYRQREGLPHSRVQTLYQDADGRLWVSTEGGLAYFAKDRFVAADGGPSTEVYAMAGDAQGNLWLSGNKGLARLHRGRFVENVPWETFGRRGSAHDILSDRGGLWMAFWDSTGVSYVKDGKVQETYASEQGPGEGQHVASIRLDADGSVWAATGASGLRRIKDGRATSLSVANGLPCNRIHWSIADREGSLWIYTACGLVRVSREDVAAWIADPSRRVTPKVWDGADGVPRRQEASTYFNPTVARSPDGTVWSTGVADVQVFNPDQMAPNAVPPPVQIETLVADHQSYAVADGLRLPPLVRDVAIEFAALTLVDPKTTRVRYRLEGHDTDWQEAVDRRLASYTNLPPGQYRFRVKAANNSGVWNEQGAQLEFSIQPAFYQTTWFRITCAALLIGLAWSGFQLRLHMRIRRLHRQFEATLEARVAERTRIARDLHDTLLQRFHGLLLQFQAAFNLLPDRPRESKQVLAGAIEQVAEAITEGRETVQGLRASKLEANDLAESLRALARDLADETGHAAPAHVEVQGTPQALHPLVRDETFRIASEALRNAFHHAEAKQIGVEICYDPRQLRVTVRDDGKGIEADVLGKGERKGHFGLSGMRERAELVGGKVAVRSGPGMGTEVEFSAPGSQAYGKSPQARSWLSRMFASRETASSGDS